MGELAQRTIGGQDAAEVADAYEIEALAAIEEITDPDEADRLLARVTLAEQAVRLARLGADRERRWGAVRLRAERRYGQLLGPGIPGRRTGIRNAAESNSTTCDVNRGVRDRARKVAAVTDAIFEDYMTNSPQPTRNGLLRKAGTPARNDRSRQAQRLKATEEQISACMEGIRQGQGQTEIGKKLGLPDNSMVLAQAFGIAAERLSAQAGDSQGRAPRPKNWNGKTNPGRLRELNGRGKPDERARLEFYNAQVVIAKLNAALESIPLDGYDLDEVTLWWLTDFHDDLISHAAWVDRTLSVVQNQLEDTEVRRKIGILRNPAGRTPEETETMARLADRLERKLGLRLES